MGAGGSCVQGHAHMRRRIVLLLPAPPHCSQGRVACKMRGCPVEIRWDWGSQMGYLFPGSKPSFRCCGFGERHAPQLQIHYCVIASLLSGVGHFIQKSQIPKNSRGEEFCFMLATSPLIPFSERLHGIKQPGDV